MLSMDRGRRASNAISGAVILASLFAAPGDGLAFRGIDSSNAINDNSTCLERAISAVGQNGYLTVHLDEGLERRGRVIGFERIDGGCINLEEADGPVRVCHRDIESIRYRDDGIVRPLWVVAGVVVGAVGGVALGHQGTREWREFRRSVGGVGGGLVGAIAGAIASSVVPGQKTIACREASRHR